MAVIVMVVRNISTKKYGFEIMLGAVYPYTKYNIKFIFPYYSISVRFFTYCRGGLLKTKEKVFITKISDAFGIVKNCLICVYVDGWPKAHYMAVEL